MKQVKILGSGCANCRNTAQLVESVAQEHGVEIALEKIEEMQQIIAYGVMRTPAVVIDGKVVHAGGVPTPAAVAQWFERPAAS
ncbi:thioredoxin family protein [Niveibacterium sp.]|uniref:thioredoxin family protein n=1 Tax=Niveibacterium sp. TaxID=2017444 RepID=UPI0035B09BD9